MTFYFWLLRRWQFKQFGESRNVEGVIKHLRKEILEAENTYNENEWCDIVLLACQGAWRSGWSPWSFTLALWSKLWENMHREWPELVDGEPCEHKRP